MQKLPRRITLYVAKLESAQRQGCALSYFYSWKINRYQSWELLRAWPQAWSTCILNLCAMEVGEILAGMMH